MSDLEWMILWASSAESAELNFFKKFFLITHFWSVCHTKWWSVYGRLQIYYMNCVAHFSKFILVLLSLRSFTAPGLIHFHYFKMRSQNISPKFNFVLHIRKSYRSESTHGWVNYDWIFSAGWVIPLMHRQQTLSHKMKEFAGNQSSATFITHIHRLPSQVEKSPPSRI